jgi:hypothetical protein
MSIQLIGFLVGYFGLMLFSSRHIPLGQWQLGAVLFNGFLIRVIFGLLCGFIAGKFW